LSNAPQAQPVAKPAAKPTSWLRENVEAIVVAVVLALLIRQYATEAFVIPTGSMAPTLLGAHVDLVCTNCGKPQAVAEGIVARAGSGGASGNAQGKCPNCGKLRTATIPEDQFVAGKAEITCDKCGAKMAMFALQAPAGSGDREVEADCSNCGFRFRNRLSSGLWPMGSISRGDRILVDKFSYRFTDPRRFEVIVFKYPVHPADNYIKRLIGLPGETIDVKNGNIYVDGKIARKPADVQMECWFPVYDSRYVEKDPGGEGGPRARRRAFREEGGIFAPTADKHGFALKKALGTEPAWLVYDRDIRDWNAYNEHVHGGGTEAEGDIRVRFEVTLGAPGTTAVARLSDDEASFEAEVGDGPCTLRRDGKEVAHSALPVPFAILKRHAVDFARADGRVTLDIDGKRAIEYEYDPADAEPTKKSEARLGAKGGSEATFHAIEIFRDVYYMPTILGAPPHVFPFQVPAGQYFCMGDNSTNSTDSRVWGTVPEGYIVGRAFMVFWPAIPGDFAVRRIR
jgi:signal peptidase I